MIKGKKAVTLIALVLTAIVLLILSGVVLTTLTRRIWINYNSN